MEQNKNVLISGASFAGLTTAYWMNKMGYKVTIVEVGSYLKKGGTPVDIKDSTVDIVKRMGLFEQIKANRLTLEKWEFKNAEDLTGHKMLLRQPGEEMPDDEFEIERDTLLNMMYETVKDDVTFIFNNSITALNETEDSIEATFKDGSQNRFEYIFGCDGMHSVVRRLWFGNEAEYSHFLGQYFSIAIVNKLLIEESTLQLYAEPNKAFMLNAYNGKTDIVFTFRPEKEIPYDFRNQEQIKKIIYDQMQGMSWRVSELKEELLNSDSLYFDKFCQIKMPSWTKSRVALVGDAGYCASPAAGMGGSLAIIGATALVDAFAKNNGNFELAFAAYNKDLRPFIEEVQESVIGNLEVLLPRTEEAVSKQYAEGISF
ncbi:FAD-dependent monooxygenase [Pedobacter sp. R20-19]|uniref:FAD-dependent monooxygenase n=1 Tax=Pedobacter sp. R20-19 TaxID=1270196 RepID=UPI0004935B60|nr:FAD-dependent monooxygenase [Pedobacter sp. R20-19]